MSGGWLELAIALAGIAALVVREFFSETARDRQAKADADAAQVAVDAKAAAAQSAQLDKVPHESAQAGQAWDAADQALERDESDATIQH